MLGFTWRYIDIFDASDLTQCGTIQLFEKLPTSHNKIYMLEGVKGGMEWIFGVASS